MSTALQMLGISEAAVLLRTGEISSRELTKACLEQIDQKDPDIHAFLTLMTEEALFRANRADHLFGQSRRTGDTSQLPPLLGIPLAVKDVLSISGVRCTCGSRMLQDYVPPFTATSVEHLFDPGAVVLGKTNMDEFAMGSSTENSAFGPTRNPWDLDRVPGGSSGGSAAAVAAGMCLGALGTDTGGSVRQPASFCGVTGLKPTYGRVSRWGLVSYGSSFDSVGPIARSVEDTALIYRAIAGFDPRDSTSARVPAPAGNWDAGGSLAGIKIGIPEEYFTPGLQPEVEQRVQEALAVLAGSGAELVPVRLPHTEDALPVYYLIAPAEASANLARYDGIRFGYQHSLPDAVDQYKVTRGEGFGAEVKRRIMLGTYALSAGYYDAYYGKAQKVRTLIRRDFTDAFQQVDVIAAPVAPTTAYRLGERVSDPLAMYLGDVFTLPANLAGIPAIAFPVGNDGQGLPVGMQLMGRHFEEDLLLRCAHTYQRSTYWHKRMPA